jgi:uncharacterized membrane protein YdjX (TVP38/TMEM64 family)
MPEPDTTPRRARKWLVALAGAFILICIALGVLHPSAPQLIAAWLLDAAHRAGPAGGLVLALLQMLIAASGILPASLLGIAAGTAYGLWTGFALSAAGTMAGALISFVLARWLFRDAISRRLAGRAKLARFDNLVARSSWRIVCLLRISPVLPFAATSYALGLSSVTLPAYLLGTLASLPPLLGYVFIGTLANSGLSAWQAGGSKLRLAMIAAGTVATVALTFFVGLLARRAQRETD